MLGRLKTSSKQAGDSISVTMNCHLLASLLNQGNNTVVKTTNLFFAVGATTTALQEMMLLIWLLTRRELSHRC